MKWYMEGCFPDENRKIPTDGIIPASGKLKKLCYGPLKNGSKLSLLIEGGFQDGLKGGVDQKGICLSWVFSVWKS